MGNNKNGKMTVLEHLIELRWRLAIAAVVFVIATIISFTQVDKIRSVLTAPLNDAQLIYLTPPEAFIANIRLSVISGIILASPVLICQVLAYLFPAFKRSDRYFAVGLVFGICVLFIMGALFAYHIVFPFVISFFLQFATDDLGALFTISEYISFVISFHLAFGLVFQLPLMTWALGRLGLLSTQFLRRNRKYALLIMLVLSAVITPPDIISQAAMVGPLLLLYEIGLVMVLISEKRRKRELTAEDAGE